MLVRLLFCVVGLCLLGWVPITLNFYYGGGPTDPKSYKFMAWERLAISGSLAAIGFLAWIVIEVGIGED